MLVKWHELFITFLLTAYIRSSYLRWTPIRHLSISLEPQIYQKVGDKSGSSTQILR